MDAQERPLPVCCMQVMNVYSTALGTEEFKHTRAECLGSVELSYRQAEEYVVATFEVRCTQGVCGASV